jgi:hypothetical protein
LGIFAGERKDSNLYLGTQTQKTLIYVKVLPLSRLFAMICQCNPLDYLISLKARKIQSNPNPKIRNMSLHLKRSGGLEWEGNTWASSGVNFRKKKKCCFTFECPGFFLTCHTAPLKSCPPCYYSNVYV